MALFDAYTIGHACGGSLQFIFIPFAWTVPVEINGDWFLLNVFLHVVFEFIENMPLGVYISRKCYITYTGDAIVNSIGDVLGFSCGYWIVAVSWVQSDGSPLALVLVPLTLALLTFVAIKLSDYAQGKPMCV